MRLALMQRPWHGWTQHGSMPGLGRPRKAAMQALPRSTPFAEMLDRACGITLGPAP